MKNNYLLILIIFFLFSCTSKNEEEKTTELNNDTTELKTAIKEPAIAKVDDKKFPYGFYIINVSATETVEKAVQEIQVLQKKGNPAGYLWLPDYESLSDKELYSVFIGPFMGQDSCVKYLTEYQKEIPNAYAIKADHVKRRFTIHNKFDFRINNTKQFMILTYATPEDSEVYAAEGGEDWGWFTNDVSSYFTKYHEDEVYFGSVFYSRFSKNDIAQLKKELSLEGFGYILINGKQKDFTPHDMPDGVISSACEFFGFDYKENWQEEMSN